MLRRILFSCIVLSLSIVRISAQEGYQSPPKVVEDLILAPSTPTFSLSPMKDRYLIIQINDIPTIREQAQDEIKLAGVRVMATTNAPKQRTKMKQFEFKSMPGFKKAEGVVSGFPEDVNVLSFRWAPDGSKLAAIVEESDGVTLWVIDPDKLSASLLSKRRLNLFFGTSMVEWAPDGKSILVPFIPEGRGAVVADNNKYIAPVIQSSEGESSPARTYQDLLTDNYSEYLFDYYATSQLGVVSIESGKLEMNGASAIYNGATYSPDGKHLLIQYLKRPYSYVVPCDLFPQTTEVRNLSGVVEKTLNVRELTEFEFMGKNSTSKFPRNFNWRADMAATVYWTEPLDGGDGKKVCELRDKLVALNMETGETSELLKSEYRLTEVMWGDSDNAFAFSYDDATRMRKGIHFNPREKKVIRELFHQSREDRYADWGRLVTERNSFGRNSVFTSDKYKTVYFSGNGFSPKGAYPFIDCRTLSDGTAKRVWQCVDPFYESPVAFVDVVKGKVVTSREANEMVPNYYLVDVKKKKSEQLTFFENPYKAMQGVTKQFVEYTRKDGVKLNGTLYLPAGYKKGDAPLPTLLWAYPTEYKSMDNAGQRTDAPNQFVRFTRTSPILWVAVGYAVLNDASFPIIGEGKTEPNDTYLEQLVANAEAAIDRLVDMGVTDRRKVAVSGHSYGAFMTVNLLANSDLFAAGIARSGAYNRTLTPFGFQNESRTFWEVPEVYMTMSPFVKADKLKTPLLLIHGQADNNPGTFTLQSERMYSAIKGNGGIVRLVLLPYESHGYYARESILQQAWETYRWLEKYVKNRK